MEGSVHPTLAGSEDEGQGWVWPPESGSAKLPSPQKGSTAQKYFDLGPCSTHFEALTIRSAVLCLRQASVQVI